MGVLDVHFLPMGLYKKDLENLFVSHLGSSLKGYRAMEWTFL